MKELSKEEIAASTKPMTREQSLKEKPLNVDDVIGSIKRMYPLGETRDRIIAFIRVREQFLKEAVDEANDQKNKQASLADSLRSREQALETAKKAFDKLIFYERHQLCDASAGCGECNDHRKYLDALEAKLKSDLSKAS